MEFVIPGICEELPCENEVIPLFFVDCTLEPLDVICGCNDSTYLNPCAAIQDGINDWVKGPCQTTSLTSQNIHRSVRVFPNPVGATLIISQLDKSCPYQILGISGNAVQEGVTTGPLEVRSLPAGIYLLRIWQAKSVQTIRWVKQE